MRLTKSEQKRIAGERIEYLIDLAEKTYNKSPALSNRYIKIALDLRNKYKVKLTSAQKKKFCKKCSRFLKPGDNCRVRIKNKTILYHCLACSYIRRQGMGKKK